MRSKADTHSEEAERAVTAGSQQRVDAPFTDHNLLDENWLASILNRR
jgi:hypothetical protein